jgi:hypothetical protein
MSKNLRNIIKETLNESDFDWIGEDLIKVGNCFIMNEYLRIQIDKIVFRLDSVGVPLVHRDFTEIHFKYKRNNIYDGINDFTKTYSEVEQWLEQGIIVPTDCTDVT